jgi:Flp pilus assembly protein TadD
VIAEAEKLLSQGSVADACARGEEARRISPALPQVYRFLGRCYNRAGKSDKANESNRKYLELAPNAPDAVFVRGAIK